MRGRHMKETTSDDDNDNENNVETTRLKNRYRLRGGNIDNLIVKNSFWKQKSIRWLENSSNIPFVTFVFLTS